MQLIPRHELNLFLVVAGETLKAIAAVGAAVVGVAVAPVLAPAALGTLGFTAGGVAAGIFLHCLFIHSDSRIHAGSIAAGMQAGMGNVVAGSLFAGAQSVAAGGTLPAIGSIISAGVSGAGAYVGAGYFASGTPPPDCKKEK